MRLPFLRSSTNRNRGGGPPSTQHDLCELNFYIYCAQRVQRTRKRSDRGIRNRSVVALLLYCQTPAHLIPHLIQSAHGFVKRTIVVYLLSNGQIIRGCILECNVGHSCLFAHLSKVDCPNSESIYS